MVTTEFINDENPIRSVNGLPIRCPSSWDYEFNDVSSSDAGRTEDVLMHKEKIAEKRKLNFAWNGLTLTESAEICKRTSSEYMTVEYYDIATGVYRTGQFYRGDVKAKAYMFATDKKIIESLSFNLIER